MDVLTFETCWAVNSEIIKQESSSWSIFIQLWKCSLWSSGLRYNADPTMTRTVGRWFSPRRPELHSTSISVRFEVDILVLSHFYPPALRYFPFEYNFANAPYSFVYPLQTYLRASLNDTESCSFLRWPQLHFCQISLIVVFKMWRNNVAVAALSLSKIFY